MLTCRSRTRSGAVASKRMKIALANLARRQAFEALESVQKAEGEASRIESEHGLPTHEEFLAAKQRERPGQRGDGAGFGAGSSFLAVSDPDFPRTRGFYFQS